MKRRNLFLTLGLTLGIGSGVAAGLGASRVEAKVVDAETSTAATGLIIGLNDNAHNFADNCIIAVEYYGGTNRTVKADQIGDYLYSVTLPSGITGFNVYRLNPSEDEYLPYDGAPKDDVRYNVFNYTYDSSKNMVVFDNSNFSTHDYTASNRTVVPTGARYVYHHDSASWIGDWFNASASPRLVTFANNYYGTYKQFIEMDRIGNTQYMEVELDKALCLDNYYYARLNPAVAVGDGAVWNQTTDITINRAGGLIMGLTTSTDGKVNWQGSTTDANYAEYWGAKFEATITCSGAGAVTASLSAWNAMKSDYENYLTSAQQGIVRLAEGAIDGETYLSRAIYRYDYIVLHKKSLQPAQYADFDNYISRSAGGGLLPGTTYENNNSNTTIIAIIAISAIALAVAGTFFVIRRRKENN